MEYDVFEFTVHLKTTIDGQEYEMKYGNSSDLLEAELDAMKRGYFKLLRKLGKFHPQQSEAIHDKQETPEVAA